MRIDANFARLVIIGLASGLLSALFGVGGGVITVSVLIIVAHWTLRSATATSLAAIGITATAGVVAYVIHGDVQPAFATLVGLPAAAGAVGGTALQQRLHARTLTYAFALVLVGIAVDLVLK